MSNPRVTDNDKGEISVTLAERELRGWSYRERKRVVNGGKYGYSD